MGNFIKHPQSFIFDSNYCTKIGYQLFDCYGVEYQLLNSNDQSVVSIATTTIITIIVIMANYQRLKKKVLDYSNLTSLNSAIKHSMGYYCFDLYFDIKDSFGHFIIATAIVVIITVSQISFELRKDFTSFIVPNSYYWSDLQYYLGKYSKLLMVINYSSSLIIFNVV